MPERVGTVYVDVKTRGVRQAQSQLRNFAASAGSLLAAIGAAQIFREAVQFGKDIVEATNKQIEAEAILAQTLKASGQYTEEFYQGMLKSAQAIQAASIYGDEELLPVMAQFARLGSLSADQINRATQLTADLAAATGRDLRAAQMLVFYALQGNVGMLRRAGIELDQAVVKSGDINRIMGEIESKVGGSAQALANTFGGALKQIQNIIGDIKEDFGKAFLESPAMQRSFEYIREFFNYLREFFDSEVGKEWINSMAEGFERLLKSILPTVKALSDMSLTMAPLLALTPGIHGILAAMGTNFGEWYKNLKDMNTELGKFVDHMESYTSGWQTWKRGLGEGQPYTPRYTPQTTPTGGGTAGGGYVTPVPAGDLIRANIELQGIQGQFQDIKRVIVDLPPAMNPWLAQLKIIGNNLALQKDQWAGIAKNMALAVAQGQSLATVMQNALPQVGALIGGALGGNVGAFVGELGGTLLANIFNPDKMKTNINFTQNININIGEGQISERAFWDDLVMRHIVPSFERGGVSPVPEGGAG